MSELIERYQAVGTPRFSDVSDRAEERDSYADALVDGERLLRAGRWASFGVEKTYVLHADDISAAVAESQCGWRYDTDGGGVVRCHLSAGHRGPRHACNVTAWDESTFGALAPGQKSYYERRAEQP